MNATPPRELACGFLADLALTIRPDLPPIEAVTYLAASTIADAAGREGITTAQYVTRLTGMLTTPASAQAAPQPG